MRPRQQRIGRLIHWLIVLLFAVLLGLCAAIWYARTPHTHFESNPELAKELAEATILDEPSGEPLPGEWPQWRGPYRDGISRETGLLASWPTKGPEVLWRQPCGDGYSAPIVKGDRLYLMERSSDDQESVLCRNALSGEEIWRTSYQSTFKEQYGSGPRSTLVLSDGRLYTVGASGVLNSLEAVSGGVAWSHDLLTEYHAPNLRWGVSFSPLIEGDLLITNPGGPNGNSVVAFDKAGKAVWHALDDPAGYGAPVAVTAAGERQLLVFTGKALVSLSPKDGKLFWRFPWATSFEVNAATPVVFRAKIGNHEDNYVFITSGYNKGCALLKLVAGPDGKPDVKQVYQGTQLRSHFASPVRWGNYVFGFDETDLVCLDLRTGEVAWSQKGFDKGSALIADGRLIILSEKGELALAEADPKEYREISRFRVNRKRTWTVPVVANGRLYLRTQEEIICFALTQPPR
jgi:outer membrane protein assembly factor BamB